MIVVSGLFKGGSTKTTTALFIAANLWRLRQRPVTLVDADPVSQTAFDWVTESTEFPPEIDPVVWNRDEIVRNLASAAHRGDVVIDVGAASIDRLKAALCEGGHLVMPLRPNKPEMRRLPATIGIAQDMVRVHRVEIYPLVVLAAVFASRYMDERAARDSLREHDIPTWEGKIPDLTQYSRAFGTFPAEDEHYTALTRALISEHEEIGAAR